jgi:cytochrome c oxidase subunit I+III
MFVGFNLTFLPQHNAGLLGMVRRVFTYTAELGVGSYNLISTIGAYVTALGVLTFVWNFVQTVRSGQAAGDNPWNANTLEWTIASPAPAYLFHAIPEVRSRDPVWNGDWSWWEPPRRGDSAGAADPSSEHSRDRAPHQGKLWRELAGTTVMDARPESIIRIAGDSIWPFVAAVMITLASVALLFNWLWVGVIGTLAAIAAMIVWMWPTREERELPGAGATLGHPDLPVYTSGTASADSWAMALSVLGVGITYAYVIFSYYYLRFHAPSWPPSDVPLPGLAHALASLAVLLLSAVPMFLAERAVRRGDQRRLRLGLGVSAGLGCVFLALQTADYLQLGLAPQANAYSAIVVVASASHLAIVVAGLIVSAIVQAQAWRGHFYQQRFVAVQNTALYWYFAAGSGIVTFAMLYLTPHLL